jgi:uncharacterized protein (DUF2249 family)
MQEIELGTLLRDDTVLLDVRPSLAGGQDPFQQIMAALPLLGLGQGLAIRAPFEPRPLLGVLAAKGYQAHSTRLAADDWVVEFLPSAPRSANAAATQAPPSGAKALDVRGLEPPEPLVRILAACQALACGETLLVIHERRPELLYPRLEGLGLRHQTEALAEDSYRISITRPSPDPVRP